MKQFDINQMEEQLLLYYDGKLTVEERRQVEAWMVEADENRRIAEQVQMLCLATDAVNVMQKVDTEKALKKVKSRMVEKKIGLWQWTQRIAAILSIPLLLALFVQYMNDRDTLTQMIEVKTNPGMTTTVVLPDSTVVCLNSESSLRYPMQFDGSVREVTLSGEAYFEVAKDSKKKFMVVTPHRSRIEVLGTHFNVEAYPNEVDVATTLVEGKVCFLYEAAANVTKKVMMAPGQKLIYNSVNNSMQLDNTSCLSEIAWKDGKIIFSDTPLGEALKMLEKRYNVAFVVDNKMLMDNSFTGAFTDQRLERILEYFRISSKLRWRYLESPDIRDEKSKIEIY